MMTTTGMGADNASPPEITVAQFEDRFHRAGESAATGEPECRSGENWDTFLAGFKLVGIRDAGAMRWSVDSVSGHTYEVRLMSRRDGDGLYMHCTCPARRGSCRHRDAVENMLMAEAAATEDYDALDWLERIE